jgi:hypothetical protein
VLVLGVHPDRLHQRPDRTFYRQFALTIAISTVISAFNSLTLSPALAALLLRSHKPGVQPGGLLFGWFFRLFNYVFGAAANAYVGDDPARAAPERDRPAVLRHHAVRHLASCSTTPRPPSSPTRTRATSSASPSCRMAHRSTAPMRWCTRSATSCCAIPPSMARSRSAACRSTASILRPRLRGSCSSA